MCAVSMVMDYGQRMLPAIQTNHTLTTPYFPQVEIEKLRRDFDELKKLVEAAKEFDKATGQPDCVDPAKHDWYNNLEQQVKAAEVSSPTSPLTSELIGEAREIRNFVRDLGDITHSPRMLRFESVMDDILAHLAGG